MLNKSYIYQFLSLIPEGKVVSYKLISQLFGVHPRCIARIMGQNEYPDEFPCYKVLNNGGKLGGYTNVNGLDEKIRRLKKDKIEINHDKVADKYFWYPKYDNFFLAIPIKDKKKFKQLYDEIKQVDRKGVFNLQKVDSPHITISYFGKISLDDFHKMKDRLEKSKTSILSYKKYKLNKVNNFDRRTYFIGTHSSTIINDTSKFNEQIHGILGIKPEKRQFYPHITVFKKRGNINKELELKIIKIMNKYEFKFDLSQVTFYCAVDKNFQTHIFDVI